MPYSAAKGARSGNPSGRLRERIDIYSEHPPVRSARRFAARRCDEQRLVRAAQRHQKQGRPLFLTLLHLNRSTVMPGDSVALGVLQLRLELDRLSNRLHRADIDLMDKHAELSVPVYAPVHEIHPVRIQIDYGRTQDAPKNVDSPAVDDRRRGTRAFRVVCRPKWRPKLRRLPYSIFIHIKGPDKIAHGCNK